MGGGGHEQYFGVCLLVVVVGVQVYAGEGVDREGSAAVVQSEVHLSFGEGMFDTRSEYRTLIE